MPARRPLEGKAERRRRSALPSKAGHASVAQRDRRRDGA